MQPSPKLPENVLTLTHNYFYQLQKNIIQALEAHEPSKRFFEDKWERTAGGGGLTCVLEDGQVFAKAGVNFSHIHGDELPVAATSHRNSLSQHKFHAMGVSLVIHPNNPYVPTAHANVRFFMAQKDDNTLPIWWFGGGFDLTPYYGFDEDCKHWHQMAKAACTPFGDNIYPRFKKWCDEYFYLPHRNEPRGIGGLFFDDYNETSFEHSFQLTQSIGDHFSKGYLPIVERRKKHSYGKKETAFQQYRRGRYVEFNLLYDRGTLFGIQSQGRTESILMSLPPQVSWKYNWHPETDSAEAKLYKNYLIRKEWA